MIRYIVEKRLDYFVVTYNKVYISETKAIKKANELNTTDLTKQWKVYALINLEE